MAGKTGPENHVSRAFDPGEFTVGIAIQMYEIGIGRFYIDITVFMPGHFFHRRIEIAGDRVHFFSGQVIPLSSSSVSLLLYFVLSVFLLAMSASFTT